MGVTTAVFTMGQDVASNIGYFLYRLYKNNLYHLPQVAPTVFPIEKGHRSAPTPHVILSLFSVAEC